MLSYLFFKALKHMTLSSIAWYFIAIRTGEPPTKHWAAFLSAYGTLYVASAPLQPAKFALVAALTPAVDRTAASACRRLGVSKSVAVAVLVASGVVVGSVLWALLISLAGLLAGVPLW